MIAGLRAIASENKSYYGNGNKCRFCAATHQSCYRQNCGLGAERYRPLEGLTV
jgi:hypothetical protein